MSMLASELERVSTADTLYSEEDVAGKGVGCIASKDIKKGSLILRETPILILNVASVKEILGTFMKMSEEDQEKYMMLNDAFYGDNTSDQWLSQWSNETTMEMDMSKDQASKVLNIYRTNSFENGVYHGVCLKMSRFNHSCCSNAHLFWNVDTRTNDIRAMRKIRPGEEITVNYKEDNWVATREERQSHLKKEYNFDCNCKACDATEAEMKKQASLCNEYNKKKNEKEEFRQNGLMDKEAECLKQMYGLAKVIKTVSRRNVLMSIVQEAFYLHIKGFMFEGHSRNREEAASAWMKYAKKFATIGLGIATTLFGENNSLTQQWIANRTQYCDPSYTVSRRNFLMSMEQEVLLQKKTALSTN
jgi:hypothetical protein